MSAPEDNNSSDTPHTIAILVENKFGVLAKVQEVTISKVFPLGQRKILVFQELQL